MLSPGVPFGGRQGTVLQRLQRQLLGAVPVERVGGDVEVQLALPALYLVVHHSHPSSTASRASTSSWSIVSSYSCRTAITVRANQQRLSSGSQPARVLGAFLVVIQRRRRQRQVVEVAGVHTMNACTEATS